MVKQSLKYLFISTSVLALIGIFTKTANAQSIDLEIDRNTPRAAVQYLSNDLKKMNSDVQGLRTNARIMNGVGDIANAVPVFGSKAATFFKVTASTEEWAADKFESFLYVEAAKTLGDFAGIQNGSLTDSEVKKILVANPKYASLVNAAGIQTVKNAVLSARNDRAAFETRLALAQNDISELRTQSNEIIKKIDTNFDNIDSALTGIGNNVTLAAQTTRKLIETQTFEIIDNSKKLAKIQSQQVSRIARQQKLVRSDIAQSITQGLNAEQAATRAYFQSKTNTKILGKHTTLLTRIDTRTYKIGNGVTFLATSEFNRLRPEDRMSIIIDESHPTNIAVFGHLSANDKKLALEESEALAQSQKLEQDIVSGVQTTMALVKSVETIGSALGWEFVEKKEFQEGVKYLNAAGGLVTAYFSGNPTMAINAVTTLFASPNTAPSPGEAQILYKLALMDRKLDELLEGQQEIKDIINASTEKLERIQYQSLYKLDHVKDGVDDLKLAATSILASIHDFSPQRIQWNNCVFIKSKTRNNTTIKNLRKIYTLNKAKFNTCYLGIQNLWPETDERSEDYHTIPRLPDNPIFILTYMD